MNKNIVRQIKVGKLIDEMLKANPELYEKMLDSNLSYYFNEIATLVTMDSFSETTETGSFREKTFIEVYCKTCGKRLDDEDQMSELFGDKVEAIEYVQDYYGWKVIGDDAFCEDCQ